VPPVVAMKRRKFAFKSEPTVDYLDDPGDPPTCETCTNPCPECSDWWRDRRGEVVSEFRTLESWAEDTADKYIETLELLDRIESTLADCESFLEKHECDAFAGCSICRIQWDVEKKRKEIESAVDPIKKK
jgi:hypothetical protein